MRERWLSGRAIALHVGVLVAVPGCAIAAWWQINRAQDGNQLSYLYSVMWPVFGLLAIIFWWMLIHTDYDTVGLKGMRRLQAEAAPAHAEAADAATAHGVPTSPADPPVVAEVPMSPAPEDDPELAAYNARLAQLASQGPKTWRRRESVVVRRAR
ncbi:MAG TPA: hypothetical protein VG346_14825 [Acidimicrobiales bacterium]|nr:hypothetical protein [Acidimicrobiales bacterium]